MVAVHQVVARSAVRARIRRAFVNVVITIAASEAVQTITTITANAIETVRPARART